MQLCAKRFDDLTGTIFSGRHQSITVWISVCTFLAWMCQTPKSPKSWIYVLVIVRGWQSSYAKQSLRTNLLYSCQAKLNVMKFMWWQGIKVFHPRLKTVIRAEIVWKVREGAARWQRKSHRVWHGSTGWTSAYCHATQRSTKDHQTVYWTNH